MFGIFFLIFFLLAFWFWNSFIKEKPNCFDGKKNGTEEGVDCGGSCEKICPFKALKVNVGWAKSFPINNKGFYNGAAMVENPNFNYALKMNYDMKFLNSKGIVIGEKKDIVELEPLEKKIIFYPSLNFRNQKIVKTFFKKGEIFDLEEKQAVDKKIIVNAKELSDDGEGKRLKITLENKDFKAHRDIQVFAVLLGTDGNVINMSRTYLEYIDKEERKVVYMTWPIKFKKKVASIKIYIKEDRL